MHGNPYRFAIRTLIVIYLYLFHCFINLIMELLEDLSVSLVCFAKHRSMYSTDCNPNDHLDATGLLSAIAIHLPPDPTNAFLPLLNSILSIPNSHSILVDDAPESRVLL